MDQLIPIDPMSAIARQFRATQPWRPFPVDFFPHAWGEYVVACSQQLDIDPGMVAVPALGSIAGMIGTRWVANANPRGMKPYRQPCCLWAATIANASTGKSPAWECFAVDIAQNHVDASFEDTNRIAHSAYRMLLDSWKSGEKDTRGEEPKKPGWRQAYVDDCTFEALAEVMDENPYGMLLIPDELSTFLESLTRYKGKGQSSDSSRYLKLWDARMVKMSRRGGDKKIIKAIGGLSISATIQPDRLAKLIGPAELSSGFMARWILAMPPGHLLKFQSETFGSTALFNEVADSCKDIASQTPSGVWTKGERDCVLTPAGSARYWEWDQQWARDSYQMGDEHIVAARGKLKAMALRFALMRNVMSHAISTGINHDRVRLISDENLDWGIRLAEWCEYEARRVYSQVLTNYDTEPSSLTKLRSLWQWLGRVTTGKDPLYPNGVTMRDITRTRIPEGNDEARQFLAQLSEHGLVVGGMYTPPRGQACLRYLAVTEPRLRATKMMLDHEQNVIDVFEDENSENL